MPDVTSCIFKFPTLTNCFEWLFNYSYSICILSKYTSTGQNWYLGGTQKGKWSLPSGVLVVDGWRKDEVQWMLLARADDRKGILHHLPHMECTLPPLLFLQLHPCLRRTRWDGGKEDVWRGRVERENRLTQVNLEGWLLNWSLCMCVCTLLSTALLLTPSHHLYG